MLEVYVDIDSTLNDHANRIRRNSKNGEILPSAFTRGEIMMDNPLPLAQHTLKELKKRANINYLTSRNFEDAHSITVDWLSIHGFPQGQVHVVQSHHEKVDFFRSHPCDLFIDDMTAGHECGEPYILTEIIRHIPVPFERFRGNWEWLLEKYTRVLPNGESFLEFMARNLKWWRENEQEERISRIPYYENFLQKVSFQPVLSELIKVGELGAGPLGGIIKAFPQHFPTGCVFIDILAQKQKQLGFVDWERDLIFESPFEDIPLPDNFLDVVVSYNALDHGWDIQQAIREAVRVSKKCYLAFDCKGGNNPPHDKLDHYQKVDLLEVKAFAENSLSVSSLHCFDLKEASPGFHFAHNWGFPVMCMVIEK